MTNPIKHKIKEQGEKFEEKFVPMLRMFVRQPVETATEKEIKSFLLQSKHELLDTIVEVLEKLRPCQHCNTKQEILRLLKDSKE